MRDGGPQHGCVASRIEYWPVFFFSVGRYSSWCARTVLMASFPVNFSQPLLFDSSFSIYSKTARPVVFCPQPEYDYTLHQPFRTEIIISRNHCCCYYSGSCFTFIFNAFISSDQLTWPFSLLTGFHCHTYFPHLAIFRYIFAIPPLLGYVLPQLVHLSP